MLQEQKLIGQIKRSPCSNCGCKIYYVFEDPRVKANGIYCSMCGKWLKFETSPKFSRARKRTQIRKQNKEKRLNRNKYIAYLKSNKWKHIRQLVAKRDDYKCQSCGKNVKNGFEIHHRNYKHLFHEEEDLNSLICLCKNCHERISIKQHLGRRKKE